MGTTAVPLDLLGHSKDATAQPLCPQCHGGRLHPYAITFDFPTATKGLHFTSERVEWLEGWVAVCVGNTTYLRDLDRRYADEGLGEDAWESAAEVLPCGFTMTLTPRRATKSLDDTRTRG